MKKVLAFSGSNSSTSINEQLLKYAAEQFNGEVTVIQAKDYEAPLYSIDREQEGIPAPVQAFNKIIAEHDAFIIASPEHNGMVSAFMKNNLDWLSRTEKKFLGENAPVFLLSTSPGAGGAANHLVGLEKILGYFGGVVKAKFSLKTFHDNFQDGAITGDQDEAFKTALKAFEEGL